MAQNDRHKSDRELIEEMADRARRTETRVTKIANHIGVDAGGAKPRYEAAGNLIRVTSPKTALDEIIAAVPHGSQVGISLYCGNDFLGTIALA